MTMNTTLIVQYSHPHTPGKDMWCTFGTNTTDPTQSRGTRLIPFLFCQFEDAVEQAMKVGDVYAGNPWHRRIVDLETEEVLWQRNGSEQVKL